MSSFFPNLYVKSIKDINLEEIKKQGIRNFIIDIDNTLVETKVRVPDEDLKKWFKRVEENGIKVCLLSNNNKNRVGEFSKDLNILTQHRAAKPMRRGFKKAMVLLGAEKNNTAVIGDQIFTDIYGGNRMGLFTILVMPISPKESPLSKVKRPLEKIVLRKFAKYNNKNRLK